MRKVKEIIGLPVLTYDAGKKIGVVKDALFDPQYIRVLAFLVDESGWQENAKVVPFSAVKAIGRDALIVNNASDAVPAADNEEVRQSLTQRRDLSNVRVFTEDGRELGAIGDAYVDEQTGEVKGFEVSGGFFSDTMRGRRFVPTTSGIKLGQDIAYVPSSLGNEFEREATGGFQRQAEEAQRIGGEWVGRSREEAERYSDQFRRSVSRAAEKLRQATLENQKRFVTGRVTDRAVTAPDGRVIVEKGQKVTPETADEAERQGVLGDLVIAVGGAGVREVAEDLREQAMQAFEDLKRSFADLRRGTQMRGEQRRIDYVLGRPVNRVVLDHQDQAILNRGDIVTHQAIERARAEGVLDLLLSSVSPKEPRYGSESAESSISEEATSGNGQPPEGPTEM